MSQKPTIGRCVHYTLCPDDCVRIGHARRLAGAREGNSVEAGETYPMTIVRVWPDGSVNGQVLLDGDDSLWATSVKEGKGPGTWAWPVIAKPKKKAAKKKAAAPKNGKAPESDLSL